MLSSPFAFNRAEHCSPLFNPVIMQPIQPHADLVCHVFPIQALINLICDVKTMEDAVMEMKYDSEKAPLGTMCFLNWGAVVRARD